MIDLKAFFDDLGVVVFALDERGFVYVADAGYFGGKISEMVAVFATLTYSASGEAFENDIFRDVKQKNKVNIEIFNFCCLCKSAGEAVEDVIWFAFGV